MNGFTLCILDDTQKISHRLMDGENEFYGKFFHLTQNVYHIMSLDD